MSFVPPVGWSPSTVTTPITASTPPAYLLDAMRSGGFLDESGNLLSQYRWDPNTQSVVENAYGGGSYGFGDIPDPSLGTNVVLPTTRTGRSDVIGGTQIDNPYGVGGEAYNFSGVPFIGSPSGGNLFVSDDPAAIAEYNHDRRTRGRQGIATVGALVGGAAALGGALGPASGTGTATVSSSIANAGVAPAAAGAGPSLAAIEGWAPAAAAGGGGAAGAIMSNLPTIISGAASLLGGKMASDAAGDAVDAQVAAGDRALDFQRESRDIALGLVRPQLQASNVALAQMLQMTGQPIPESLRASLAEAGITDIPGFDVTQDPSYQFRLDESMKALENSAFARGGGMSGGFANQALRYAQNFASTEYANIYGRLATIGGYGPVAANTSSNAALNYGANAANTAMNTGEARASGYVAQSNAWQNALDQIARLPWDQWFPGRQPATAGP